MSPFDASPLVGAFTFESTPAAVHAFRATLADGREVELRPVPAGRLSQRRPLRSGSGAPRSLLVAPIAAPSAQQSEALGIAHPVRWLAVGTDELDGAVIGEGWFARHAGSSSSALLSLVVAPDFTRSGVARLLLETLVLNALEQHIDRIWALLPAESDEYTPVLERLRATVTRGARGSVMARIDLAGSDRQLHASAPRQRVRAAG